MISGIGSPIAETGTSNIAFNEGGGTLGKDDFLTLLIAQLGAQDPLDPMDSQDFSAQLAQFSTLEQMTNMNATLNELIEIEVATSNASTIGLIGKLVDVEGNGFEFTTGDTVKLNYVLGQDADAVEVSVFDATGKLVTTLQGETDAGNHLLSWNGFDNTGAAAVSGSYTFEVKALDASGEELSVETFTTGIVTDVLFEETGAFALVNGEKIPVGEITRVSLKL